MTHGRLIYLMGASGSGKDTVLRHLRDMLEPADPIFIAHRYITRAASQDEHSIELSADDFSRRAAFGCFALHWFSHGLSYGIGVEVDAWIAAGATVIVNGSRQYLVEAALRYPALVAVQITVDPGVLQTRLSNRGRETADAIQARLERARQSFTQPPGVHRVELDNNGRPADAARMLLALARERHQG